MTLSEALKKFQDHAGVRYSECQRQADVAWLHLKRYLTTTELQDLSTARGHATPPCQEGRGELDEVCARIRKARGL